MKFTDLPASLRMAIRSAIEKTGADNIDYLADGRIQVSLPAEKSMTAVQNIERLGFKECGGYYFPLGTDAAPERLRHFGPGTAAAPRGDKPSYWLRWTFKLIQTAEIEMQVTLPEITR